MDEVGVVGRLAARLGAAPAVRDVLGVAGRVVLRREQVREAARARLDEQDLRPGCDRVGPLDVERDLERPARVPARVARTAVLVDLGEAAVRGGAGGQPELAREGVQVALGVRVVVGVDDRDRLPGACCGTGREAVDRLDRRRVEPARRRARERVAAAVGHDELVAVRISHRRVRADGAVARVPVCTLGSERGQRNQHDRPGQHGEEKTTSHQAPPATRPPDTTRLTVDGGCAAGNPWRE